MGFLTEELWLMYTCVDTNRASGNKVEIPMLQRILRYQSIG